jgi:hypothetical protein
MDILTQVFFFEIPVLLVVGMATASLAWWYHEGAIRQVVERRRIAGLKTLCAGVLVGAWLAATTLSWLCLLPTAYFALLSMYVLFGAAGGWVALIAVALVSAAVPIAWGGILFGLARREFRSASGSPRVAATPRMRVLPG